MKLNSALGKPGRLVMSRVPGGYDAIVLADLARVAAPKLLLHVTLDDQQLTALSEAIGFFAPELTVLQFPAWDCLPYDRVGPAAEIVARRLATLTELARDEKQPGPALVLTTVNGILQRVPPRSIIADAQLKIAPGNVIATERILAFLSATGFSRTGTVVDPGDFAVRGGIIDLFPPGVDEPLRLDFFGDALESIRSFDPQSQRTTGQLKALTLKPASEVLLNEESVARFRTRYAAQFGGVDLDDPLYEAVTASRRYQGMEHWLPLFHDRLETLLDYTGECAVSFDHSADEAVSARFELIEDYYQARQEALEKGNYGSLPYKPLPPQMLYFHRQEWAERLTSHAVVTLTPFDVPHSDRQPVFSVEAGLGRNFATERATPGMNVYEAVRDHISALRKSGTRVIVSAWTEGSAERLETILSDHGVSPIAGATIPSTA